MNCCLKCGAYLSGNNFRCFNCGLRYHSSSEGVYHPRKAVYSLREKELFKDVPLGYLAVFGWNES